VCAIVGGAAVGTAAVCDVKAVVAVVVVVAVLAGAIAVDAEASAKSAGVVNMAPPITDGLECSPPSCPRMLGAFPL
jgi:hypothetical protein